MLVATAPLCNLPSAVCTPCGFPRGKIDRTVNAVGNHRGASFASMPNVWFACEAAVREAPKEQQGPTVANHNL